MYVSLYKALGADPISMNFGEVFTALQQKTIDGQENPTDVINSSKLYEVQKYLSVWDYSYDVIILGANKAMFNKFDAATQKIIRDCATEACAYQRQLNRELSAKQVAFFKEKGVTVTELTADQKAAFRTAVQPIYTEYEPIMGKDLIAIFSGK
jgi:TRAP-type C4-dicarboxylate transport system substrate-binding protein